ncbi:MAG: hypothetical protein KZQ88_16250 [Candidatus Thiodiazotropha sp. (ex Dulcina madagascariensis)]|nr:hypothetical protein [Candidatus Thiodiazotropha sp. (ex Dulcina madagascariensis)]MCU7927783.1 hypothetical protein [Candidatus Thiodiazotropha sp. (ex Dulcina madagascariensis)]
MEKLSVAINELVRLLSKNRRLRRTELIRVLNGTLDGLDAIIENKTLLQEVEAIEKRKDHSEIKDLVTDLRRFQDAFLSIESQALAKADIDKNSRMVIIKKLRYLRKDIEFLVSSSKPLKETAKETRDIVIELLDSLESPDEHHNIKHGVEKKLRKVLTLASGAIIVGVNVGMFAGNPVSSAISVSFGSALIGRSL